jgi:hypothetical protein
MILRNVKKYKRTLIEQLLSNNWSESFSLYAGGSIDSAYDGGSTATKYDGGLFIESNSIYN